MTKEQRKILENLADKKGMLRSSTVFGAAIILDNPGEWGLVSYETYEHITNEWLTAKAENQRLREALEKIQTPIHGEYPDLETVNWIAKEALKQK